MIVAYYDLAICMGRCRKDSLHAARRQRQWALAKHVNFLLERAQHVRLVQVVGSGDYNCIELIGVEKLVDIGEYVGNTETLGERAGFGAVIVADSDKLGATNSRKHGKVRQLRDRSCADKTKPDVRAQMRPMVVP